MQRSDGSGTVLNVPQPHFNLFKKFPGHGGLALNPTSSPAKSPSGADAAKMTTTEASSMLVMSGGEGYIDFRIGRRLVNHIYDVEIVSL